MRTEAVKAFLYEDDDVKAWVKDFSCDVAKPGEIVRITPVKDVIEPRVKVEGPGGEFPGVIAKVDTVGSGKTHVLRGMAVVSAGKIVGLQKGSSALDALNKNEIASQVASVQEYADNVTALTDLSIGRLDAVVLDEVVARYYETKEAGTYKVLDEAFAAEEYGVGFKKGNTDLEEKVQKAFDEMIADGTAAKISEKWFGKDIIVKP